MSYARFGPDSDVYVLFDVSGQWVVYIADSRFVADPDYPVPPMPSAGDPEFAPKLLAHYEARNRGSQVVLDSEHAGEEHRYPTAAECVTALREFAEAGLRVPDYAIDAVSRDAARV